MTCGVYPCSEHVCNDCFGIKFLSCDICWLKYCSNHVQVNSDSSVLKCVYCQWKTGYTQINTEKKKAGDEDKCFSGRILGGVYNKSSDVDSSCSFHGDNAKGTSNSVCGYWRKYGSYYSG